MKYKVVKLSFGAEELERDLNDVGESYRLIQLIPIQEIDNGLSINGRPNIKMYYNGVFIKVTD